MDDRKIVVQILVALGIREAWTLLPTSYYTFDPFPFYDIELTLQTYIYFLCHYASMMVFAYTFMSLIISFRAIVEVWFWLQSAEFIDYLLTYNSPWFHILGVGVGITVTKFAVLTIVSIPQFTKWNKPS